jgi:hypothetical protein
MRSEVIGDFHEPYGATRGLLMRLILSRLAAMRKVAAKQRSMYTSRRRWHGGFRRTADFAFSAALPAPMLSQVAGRVLIIRESFAGMIQWHPLFAQLLRPLLEGYYEVETNMPVGDAPRAADIVLVRRTSAQPPPFVGLWKDLTTWNVLEYKGPTVSARLGDLDELIELGLGIHRRLNEQGAKRKEKPLGPADVSWWYLAENLGRRFLRDAPALLGPLETWGPGVWRCAVLQRWLYLISRTALPVGQDSLPLHLLAVGESERWDELRPVLEGLPILREQYSQWLASLNPDLIKELRSMAKKKDKGPHLHIDAFIEFVGAKHILEEVGLKRVIEEFGPDRVIEELGPNRVAEELKKLREKLTPEAKQILKDLSS